MKIGDKVLAEGEVTQVCDGFCVVRFRRVGTQAVTHVRVTDDALHIPAEPKAKRAPVAE